MTSPCLFGDLVVRDACSRGHLGMWRRCVSGRSEWGSTDVLVDILTCVGQYSFIEELMAFFLLRFCSVMLEVLSSVSPVRLLSFLPTIDH